MNTTPHPPRPASDGEDPARRELEERFLDAYARGESLQVWLTRYPQHAAQLAELALAIDAQALGLGRLPAAPPAEVDFARDALLRAVEDVPLPARAAAEAVPAAPAPGLAARAQALGLSLPQLARQLRLTPDLLFKLDRGYLRLETVPRRFLAHIAAVLQTTTEGLLASLPSGPAAAAAVGYYTRDQPQEAQQQTFLEALAHARGLPAAERERWTAAARAEGLAS
jgi:hypothetical protein